MARKKNEISLKEPVRIRKKELKDGNKSLYLEIQKVGMVDWEKVKKINTTLVDWVDKNIDDKEGLSESSTRSKRNLKNRIVEYLKYIN